MNIAKKLSFSKNQIIIIGLALAGIAAFAIYITFAATGFSGWNERHMVNLVNQHRNGHGTASLPRGLCVTNAAREHAQAMANRGTIYHSDLLNLLQRHCGNARRADGSSNFNLGENVGMAGSTEAMFNAYLNSQSHHANIDERAWNLVGMGSYVRDDVIYNVQIYAQCAGNPNCNSNWTNAPSEMGEPAAPPPPPNPRPVGWVDSADCTGVKGWAKDDSDGNQAIRVHFYLNAPAGASGSVWGGDVQANVYRSDVGTHGYVWSIPDQFKNGQRYTVYAYPIDIPSNNGDPSNPLSNGSGQYSFTCAPQQATAPITNPVGNWKFDEALGNAADSSGYGNTAVPSGATRASGKSGNAMAFDGVDDYVNIAHSNSLNFNRYTVGAWVYPRQSKSDWQPIFTKEATNGQERNFGLYMAPGNQQLHYSSMNGSCNGWLSFNAPAYLSLNTWTHVAMSYDGGTMRLYVNGSLVASNNAGNSICQNTHPIKLGRELGAYQPFNGLIDELKIYNRAISASEVSSMASSGTATPQPPAPQQPQPPAPTGGTGLNGYYYNSYFTSPTALSRIDSRLDFNWGAGVSPGGSVADAFTAMWYGYVTAPTSGNYYFDLVSDDGSGVWINGKLVNVFWRSGAAQEQQSTTPVYLNAGQKYPIKIAYYDQGGPGFMQLKWRGPNIGSSVVPASAFSLLNSNAGLTTQIFGNVDFVGTPAITRMDPFTYFWWGEGGPASGIGTDYFSVRMTGKLTAPTTGTYTFKLDSDDGSRLWLGGSVLIDYWGDHGLGSPRTATRYMTAGQAIDIRIDQYERGGAAGLSVVWSGPGVDEHWIDPQFLSR